MRKLLLCLVLGAAAPAAAQTAAAPESAPAGLPPWVVPVLRLVSETHVEPTTGIVLSRSGLVLVPGDFAAIGDEVVVLDGGNDIVRHGRPARLHSAYPDLGLKVLAVPGLSRSGAPVAATLPGDGDTVHLRAFPPAEQIAEGEPPLRRFATTASPGGGETPSIAAGTPLPNVTGALLDDCGSLAGMSVAGGVQTMAPSAATRYRWLGALRQVLEALHLPADGVPCPDPAAEQAAPTEPEARQADDPQAARPEPPAAAPAPPAAVEPDEPDEEAGAGSSTDPAAEPPPTSDEAFADPEAEPAAAAGEEPPVSPRWWLAGALLLLAVALVVVRAAWRLRHSSARGAAAPAGTNSGAESDSLPPGPGDGDVAQAGLQPRLGSRLVLKGRYADGRPFEIGAAVAADAINLDIGRGGADLALESLAVSRRHARLNGTRTELTIADLGSRNGTSIDGVPCLEGEIIFLEPGCTVVLGDVRFTVSVEPEGGRP